jgi:hypothetical protein
VRIETQGVPNISVIPKGGNKTITGGNMGLGKVVYL